MKCLPHLLQAALVVGYENQVSGAFVYNKVVGCKIGPCKYYYF